MMLYDIGLSYKKTAQQIYQRMRELKESLKTAESDRELTVLRDNLRILRGMYMDCLEISAVCIHYYNGSVKKNERYLL